MSEFREDCLHDFFILPPSSGCFRPSRRLLILLCNLSWPTPCAKECSPLDRGISDTRGCLYFSLLLISLRPLGMVYIVARIVTSVIIYSTLRGDVEMRNLGDLGGKF